MNKIDWDYLSQNSNAIPILEKNLDEVDWSRLSMNINAIPILEKNLDDVDWTYLCKNINAISMLDKNLDNVFSPPSQRYEMKGPKGIDVNDFLPNVKNSINNNNNNNNCETIQHPTYLL